MKRFNRKEILNDVEIKEQCHINISNSSQLSKTLTIMRTSIGLGKALQRM